uniref:RING-Gid-type domain-containing protein n=1 Tax=Hemiselmis andersenii TaxID=464988 RepID=A0A6T8PEU0_HEMAN
MAQALLKECDRLCKKQKLSRSQQLEHVSHIALLIANAKEEVSALGGAGARDGGDAMEVDGAQESTVPATQEALARLREGVTAAAAAMGDTKESLSAVAKLGKMVDKTMPPDLGKAVTPVKMDPTLVNKAVLDHLLRTGKLDVARTLAEEAGEELDEDSIRPFADMVAVTESLKRRELGPAREWAARNAAGLEAIGSDVGFGIVRMEYLQLVKEGKVVDAVRHARGSFDRYMPARLREVQRLMGCLAFVGRLDTSPYASFFDEGEWDRLSQRLAGDGSRLLGLPRDLPLGVCVEAGVKALPSLLKFASVMQGRIGEWGSKTALPVEIDLGPERKYHSVFVCPVSREQASADNPPMMMQCGHVLCEHSLKKVSRGAARFKCPYCPVEVSVHGSTRLHL